MSSEVTGSGNYAVDWSGVVLGEIPSLPPNVALGRTAREAIGLIPPRNPLWVRRLGARIARAGAKFGGWLNR